MTFGAEPKKMVALGGLVVLMLGVFYYEFFAGDSEPQPVTRTAAVAPPPVIRGKTQQAAEHRQAEGGRASAGDWKPRLGPKNPEDRPDPATINPTLSLSLLAKVQSVEAGPPGRNLFAFGSAPPPPSKIVLPHVPTIAVNHPPATAPPMQETPIGPPPPPVAPPMTFKYYGDKVSRSDGHKAAFLLDGEDILIVGENDTFKRRYKVIKIGVTSITIEDTQFKSTQTLQLQENVPG